MPDYRAESSTEPKLQAWLFSDDKGEAELDPLEPRRDGWRLIVEYADPSIASEPVRSTWMVTLLEAIQQMDHYWPEAPAWKRLDTGAAVDLNGMIGHKWEKLGPANSSSGL